MNLESPEESRHGANKRAQQSCLIQVKESSFISETNCQQFENEVKNFDLQ